MPWLALLWRWFRWAVKWTLVAIGAFLSFGLAIDDWHAGHIGLGAGIVVAIVLAVVKGVLTGLRQAQESAPPLQR